jgi:hypothetical protein
MCTCPRSSLAAAVADRRISIARHDAALAPMLGLKAAPGRHRRVLVLTTGIWSPAQGAFPFVLPDVMRARGVRDHGA